MDYIAPLKIVVCLAPKINVPALADCDGLRRGGIDLEGVGGRGSCDGQEHNGLQVAGHDDDSLP